MTLRYSPTFYSYADIVYIAKKGYAILDSQNLHIKLQKDSLSLTKQLCNDPFIFLLWRIYKK